MYRLKGISVSVRHSDEARPTSCAEGPPPGLPGSFGSLFDLVYQRLVVTHPREQLCKDFCLVSNDGRFLLLASQTPSQTSAAAGQGDPNNRQQQQQEQERRTDAAAGPATPPLMQQQQQQPEEGLTERQYRGPSAGGGVPGVPCLESTTIHLVRGTGHDANAPRLFSTSRADDAAFYKHKY